LATTTTTTTAADLLLLQRSNGGPLLGPLARTGTWFSSLSMEQVE
jgi:hypothetical protein